MKCSHCEDGISLTQHHIWPHVHYKDRGPRCWLCTKCHRKFEDIILGVESFVGNVHFGNRVKLKEEQYERLLRNFCHDRPIRYAGVN
jgi:hypothetical protein